MTPQLIDRNIPETLDEIVLDPRIKSAFRRMLDKGEFYNMILHGPAGMGKSSLMFILAKESKAETLYVHAGHETSIEVIRSKVIDFCDAQFPLAPFKLVMLDEADALSANVSQGGSAQGGLRNVIEANRSDTRFILTSNNIGKILAAIKSRCTPVELRFSKEDVVRRLFAILKKENISFTEGNFLLFADTIVSRKFPDIRAILKNLEFWTIDGRLADPGIRPEGDLSEFIDMIIDEKDPRVIRSSLREKEGEVGRDYDLLAGKLFERCLDNSKICLLISETLYKMSMVKDPEIQFYTMLIKLKEIAK